MVVALLVELAMLPFGLKPVSLRSSSSLEGEKREASKQQLLCQQIQNQSQSNNQDFIAAQKPRKSSQSNNNFKNTPSTNHQNTNLNNQQPQSADKNASEQIQLQDRCTSDGSKNKFLRESIRKMVHAKSVEKMLRLRKA